MRKGGMADNIPFEMQVEIMKRLPVKSLAVFRSVSKAWKSVIDSPLFISDHTKLRRHHRLLIRYKFINNLPYYKAKFRYVSMVDNDTLSQHKFETVSNVPVSFQLFYESALVGTSQGLICISGYSRVGGCDKETAVIWNPTLGKSIAVDVPCHASVFGFGVRPDNFHPMIVMVSNALDFKPVMVFTLSSRGWRVPRGDLLRKSIGFADLSPVATDDRRIYGKAYENSINLVVAFDMVCEDFTEIHLPQSVAHREFYDFSISKIKESLALLEYYYDAKKRVCGVWMMVEDGVSKSFTKLFTVNTPHASIYTKVLGFRKNDQPITETIISELGASLDVYEPRTGLIKNLGINGVHGSFFLSSYTETLLLLDQLDEQSVKVQLQF